MKSLWRWKMELLKFLLVICCSALGVVAYIPITGVEGPVLPRLEISTLYNHTAQWNIYILALEALQAAKESSELSFYGIGSIHGYPNIPWDGVQQTANGTGYCAHMSNLFPSWHRPYVALFEQELVKAAVAVANTFPEGSTRDQYHKAAVTLRAPYLDWAVPHATVFPNFLMTPNISVHKPDGHATIKNPLYSYHFQSQKSISTFQGGKNQFWNCWRNTLRNPTQSCKSASNENTSLEMLQDSSYSNAQSIYQWVTNCPEYLLMTSTKVANRPRNCRATFEDLHGTIHLYIGGSMLGVSGHMTDLMYAGFDPTFMLHHSMIDRLIAMWQAVYPDSWTIDQKAALSTFTIKKGSIQGPDSPLTPFHNSTTGTFWTSRGIRNHTIFNYTYPEFLSTNGSSSAMREVFNKLYGPQSSSAGRAYTAMEDNGSASIYNAEITTSRFGMNGSYFVNLFFGKPASSDPSTWPSDPKFVGNFGIFAPTGQESESGLAHGSIALTTALLDEVTKGTLSGMDEAAVKSFLQKNLYWNSSPGNSNDHPDGPPDLAIDVVVATVSQASSPSEFPHWTDFQSVYQATG